MLTRGISTFCMIRKGLKNNKTNDMSEELYKILESITLKK